MGSKDKDGLNISLMFLKYSLFMAYGKSQKKKKQSRLFLYGKNISKR